MLRPVEPNKPRRRGIMEFWQGKLEQHGRHWHGDIASRVATKKNKRHYFAFVFLGNGTADLLVGCLLEQVPLESLYCWNAVAAEFMGPLCKSNKLISKIVELRRTLA